MSEAKKTISIENLFKNSFDILGKGATTFLAIYGIIIGLTFVSIILFLILGFALGLFIYTVTSLISEDLGVLYYIILISTILLGIILFIILMTLIPTLGQVALIKSVEDTKDGIKRNLKEYWELVWQKKWQIIGLYYLTFLIVMVGFIFLIIPGIILGFLMVFAPYILVLENKGIIDSIKKSYYLVKNNFWDLLIKILIIYVAYMVVAIFSNFIPFANIIINLFVGIFMAIYIYLLYEDVKRLSK